MDFLVLIARELLARRRHTNWRLDPSLFSRTDKPPRMRRWVKGRGWQYRDMTPEEETEWLKWWSIK